MLTRDQAAEIAAGTWGAVDSFYPTNRDGAYEFGCAGHGGFVVDAEALTADERKALEPHMKASNVMLFEEDCAWALLYVLTAVRARDPARAQRAVDVAQKTFDQFFSADARARDARIAKARRDEKHDVVSSALSAVDIDRKPVAGLTCVFTGDGRRHYVLGYQDCAAKDRDREPRLSNCVVLHSDSGKTPGGAPASIYDPAPLAAIAAARVAAGAPARTVIVHPDLGVYLGDDIARDIWSKGDHRYLTTATGFQYEASARACIEKVKAFPDLARKIAASTLVTIPAQDANVSVPEMQAAGLCQHLGALVENVVKRPWITEIVKGMKTARGVIGDRTPMLPGPDDPTDYDLAYVGAEFLYAANVAGQNVCEEAMASVKLLLTAYLRREYPDFVQKLDEASPATRIGALFAAGMKADELAPLLHPLDAAPAPGM